MRRLAIGFEAWRRAVVRRRVRRFRVAIFFLLPLLGLRTHRAAGPGFATLAIAIAIAPLLLCETCAPAAFRAEMKTLINYSARRYFVAAPAQSQILTIAKKRGLLAAFFAHFVKEDG